jgi:hypothetical protein
MVNLQEFVSEALVQIIDGVKSAQDHASSSGAKINPSFMYIGKEGPPLFNIKSYSNDTQYGQTIEFDVAVTALNSENVKGGIGVVGGVIGVGYKAEKGKDDSTVSRIKFSVPVFLPQQTK